MDCFGPTPITIMHINQVCLAVDMLLKTMGLIVWLNDWLQHLMSRWIKYSILAPCGRMEYFAAMHTVIKKIIEQGLSDRVIRGSQLKRVISGSAGRRYGLVNRALKSGELLRLQRGVYVLADRYRSASIHPFALAQALAAGSYISFETALSFHGWIPEKVYTTASVVPGRKSRHYVNEQFGSFSFNSLATETGFFLELVDRIQLDGQTMLVATPYRALMDLVCFRKVIWQGMGWFERGLRIDSSLLESITGEDITILKQVYKHKRMQSFLVSLALELNID